jgi:hypothetical protein
MAVRKMPDPERKTARLPPRWFIRLAWITHRRLYRWTGGRIGLWRPKPGGWGTRLMLDTEGSYGRRNRQVIAARENRVATRLRAVQHAYQAVAGHDTALTQPEPTRALHCPGHAADREIELE